MKRNVLHRIWISVWTVLSVACSGSEDLPTPQGIGEKTEIIFTLALDGARPVSRADWGDGYDPSAVGDNRDNLIHPDKLQVMLQVDGKYESLKDLHWMQSPEQKHVYYFTGVVPDVALKNGKLNGRMQVFANLAQPVSPTADFMKLTFPLQEAIPMWGVRTVDMPLQPGIAANLGTIHLLRAMAKVEVSVSEKVVQQGYQLESVALQHYNRQGYLLPLMVPGKAAAAIKETKDIDQEACLRPDDTRISTPLAFEKTSDANRFVVYVPEYKNNGSPFPSDMTVTFTNSQGKRLDYTVRFATYEQGQFKDLMDIVRNHWYQFQVREVHEKEVALELSYQVSAWDEVQVKIPDFD